MITKNITKQPKSLVEVSITVPWQDIEPKWNETLQKLAADVEISGFRKGSAPLPMVETQLGNKLQDEVLKNSMPQFLLEALKETDIIPIDYPKYQLVAFTKGQPFQFKALVTNRPQITVGDYKKIKTTRPAPKAVAEDEVNKVVEDLFKRWKARLNVPQPQKSADPAQDNTNQGGSISFQKGTSAPVTSAPTPGSDVPDDEFAKKMGAKDLAELKAKIRKDLEDHASYNNELDYEEAILTEVEKITQVDLPDVLVEDELNRMLVSLQRRVADMGLLLEDYLKGQGKTLDQIKTEWRPQAEKNVRMELGLSEIARLENVQIGDSELQAEIDKIQDAKVKQQFESEQPRLHLRHALRQTRTLDLLKKLVVS